MLVMHKKFVVLIFAGCFASLYAMEQAVTLEDAKITLLDATGKGHTISRNAVAHAHLMMHLLEEEADKHEPIPLSISDQAMRRLIKRLEVIDVVAPEDAASVLENPLQALPLPVLLEDAEVANYVDAPLLLEILVQEIAHKIVTQALALKIPLLKRILYRFRPHNPYVNQIIMQVCALDNPDLRSLIAEKVLDDFTRNAPWAIEAKYPGLHVSGSFSWLALSPDNTKLLMSDGYGVRARIYDTHTQQLLNDLRHPNEMITVKFSHDNKKIAIGLFNKMVRVWDLTIPTGQIMSEFTTDFRSVSLAWSNDDTKIAVGSRDGSVEIFDIARRVRIAKLCADKNKYPISAVAWSPDDVILAMGDSTGKIYLWDLSRLQQRATLRGHTYRIDSIAWSPDGKKIVTGTIEDMRLWDGTTYALLGTPLYRSRIGIKNDINLVTAFSADNKKLIMRSVDSGETVLLYQPGVKDLGHRLEKIKQNGCKK